MAKIGKEWRGLFTTQEVAEKVKRHCNILGIVCACSGCGEGVYCSIYMTEREIEQMNAWLDEEVYA